MPDETAAPHPSGVMRAEQDFREPLRIPARVQPRVTLISRASKPNNETILLGQ